MKYLILIWCLLLWAYNINAQNTVTIQGNFSTSNGNPVTLRCDQSINQILVEVLDGSNNPVVGEDVTATVSTGTGTLSGTLTQTTDGSGIATFDDLSYSENTDLTIQFTDTGTGSDTTKTISSIECDVNEIWTNYGGFWNTSSSSINFTRPDNSHELLAFEFDGTTFSTGVDDTRLTNNGVTFTALTIRALPVSRLPLTSGSSNPYLIALGQLVDGIDGGVDNGSTNPFVPITTQVEVASFLTDGRQGLDLGTNVTNIPTGTTARFNLSSAGITTGQIGDGVPDLLVSQTAQPSGSFDELEFIDSGGATVGEIVTVNIQSEPNLGLWNQDFYEFNSTQPDSGFIDEARQIRFFALDIVDFGITTANAGDAVALLYRPGGTSDPAFIAFNEPSLGVATQLTEISVANTEQNCDGTLPINIEIQLEDQNSNAVAQDNIEITATLNSGPGSLSGTLVQTTNGSGVATFDDLDFTIGGSHTIRFSFAGLDEAVTATIGDATGCASFIWDGSESSDWDNPDNWALGLGNTVFPDGNNAVEIPDVSGGSNRYPILNVDAGAGDLTMASVASIDLNGFLLALNGTLTGVSSGASIDASAAGSELYMSDNSAQNLIANFIEPDVANFTVENTGGVTLNSIMNITEVLDVIEGTLTTNGHITMICTFSPRQTAQIHNIEGNISGDITVEQCFPARRAFRLVSSSTTTSNSIHDNWQEGATAYNNDPNPGYGTHITGLAEVPGSGHTSTPAGGDQVDGLDWQPSGNASMYSFNNATQSWEMVLETENASTPSTPVLNSGDAYRLMIRGDRSINIQSNATPPTDTRLRSSGTYVDGSFSIPNGDLSQTATLANNWNLIGNPYHAIVNMKQLIDNSSSLSRFYTIWDPTLGGTPVVGSPGGRGAFVTYNVDELDFAIGGGASGSSDINGFLQPYQAAFIRTNTIGTATVDFTENMIDTDANQTNTFSTQGILQFPHIYTKLFAASDYGVGTPVAVNQIRFHEKSSNSFNQFDAQAFYNVDETLARLDANQIWAFERRDLPVDGESLSLLTYQYRRNNYTFEFEVGQFDGIDVYLEDTYLDETHLLEDNQLNTVDFTIDESVPASIAFDRFNIIFETETFSISD